MPKIIAEPQNFPRIQGQQKDIVPGSPTAVLACFLEVARERFREDGLPWKYAENLTGEKNEAGQPGNPRKLQVELGFSQQAVARNYRPSIYVTRGDMQARQAVIGNVAGRYLPTDTTGYYATAPVPIDFEIVSSSGGESANLADTLFFYLAANRDLIRKLYGIRDVTLPMLSGTQQGQRDKNEWITHVRIEVELTMRWITQPIAPRLREVIMELSADDGTLLGKIVNAGDK